MRVSINQAPESASTQIYLFSEVNLAQAAFPALDIGQFSGHIRQNFFLIPWHEGAKRQFLIFPKEKINPRSQKWEAWRHQAYLVYQLVQEERPSDLHVRSEGLAQAELLCFLEGFYLSAYSFQTLKSTEAPVYPHNLSIDSSLELSPEALEEMWLVCQATHLARDLVNKPLNHLGALDLAQAVKKSGGESGFNVEVLHKSKIESLGMNGLLAVNLGSEDPPSFSILEYTAPGKENTPPYILIGKGVVYDTGGLSLKLTANSMDFMKSDMAGAAAVIGAVQAVAANNLPVRLIGLVPATDNRPGKNAFAPGDVIKMMNGKTVEVKNTDAEGRMLLADALVFAQKYSPQLVIDLATLTGAAARAIGKEGSVMLGNASEKELLMQCGVETHERLVEFPLWEEYAEELKSDVADFSNLGGANAGAITAAKFLEKFIDYPWIHLDIAGPAFLHQKDSYRGKGGAAYGVRLLYRFFKKVSEGQQE